MIKLNIKKTLIWLLVIISLFGTSLIPSVSSSSAVPSPIERPQGIMLNQMHKGFLWMIRNMQSAEFTPDNVYYGVYDNTGSYSYPIIGEREREVTISLDNLIRLLNTTITRLEDIGTESDTLAYLNNLYAELQIHDELTIYTKVDSDLEITSSHDRKAVTIFYDNDRSVIDAFNKIKNNESITEQPFSGDEIFTNVFMSLIRDEISGSYEVINTWNYEDNSDAALLKDFISRLINSRWFFSEGRQLFRLPELNIMRTLLQETNSWYAPEEDPRVLEYGRFEISQLIIDDLDLQKVGQNLIISEYDYKYI
ncbi:MAG: hypothetical protein ACFFDC_18815 [Promethearchaeota archaeon]